MKILFTGGGTGGHIFPIIAIVREIRRIASGELQFFYLGPRDDFDRILLSQEGIKVRVVFGGKIRRYLTPKAIFQNIIDLLKIPIGLVQAFFNIFVLAPDIVISKGGYGSFATGLCARILQVPVFLHESDVAPGLATKLLSKISSRVFVSFPKTEFFPKHKVKVIGNPIRRELLRGSKERAVTLFRLSQEKPVILILGGSQGAERLNDLILSILPSLLQDFELIHQAGERNLEKVIAESTALVEEGLRPYYHPFGFLKEDALKQAYAACDLIISRAGSGSIFETASLQKPSVSIPIPEAAQDHQVKNAYAYASSGATVVLEEANIAPHFFLERVKFLFAHPDELEKMRQGARVFAKPEAGRLIAQEIVDFCTKK